MDINKYLMERYRSKGGHSPHLMKAGRGADGLAGLLRDCGLTVGADIGTERGDYAKVLCETIPGLMLYCVDAWASYGAYRARRQRRQEAFYKEARSKLAPYRCELVRGFSMDVVKGFADESLDWVFIDANHEFQHLTNDIAEWSKKVRRGGIVAGHDLVRFRARGELIHVTNVVEGWTSAYKIDPWFVWIGDAEPSWMWVRK